MHVPLQFMPPILQQATTAAGPHLCTRLQDIHRQVSCGVTVPFSWVLVHKVLLCSPSVNFPVLCKFWQLYGGVNGDLMFKMFQMFKLVLEKAEEPEIKLPTSAGSSKKRESSRKTSALLTIPKPLTVWITINCGKF